MADQLNLIQNLRGSTGASSKLMFPSNLFSDNTDYVKFSFYKYKGPFSANRNGSGIDVDGFSNDFTEYNQAGAEYQVYPDSKNILLYMPEDISTGYRTDWGGKGFSNVTTAALKAGGALLGGDAGGSASAVGKLIQNTAGATPTLAAEAITTALNAIGANATTGDLLQGSLGVILNPNTELMFSGFKLREFTLKFKLAPRNNKEARDIREIVGQFKRVALPTFGPRPGGALDFAGNFQGLFEGSKPADAKGKASNANFIGVPGLCQVKFMNGTGLHEFLPQYKLCAITGVEVNYTPDGVYTTYQGQGSPVATELALTFAEIKLVYSQDINTQGASY